MVTEKHLQLEWAMNWFSRKQRKKTYTKVTDTSVAEAGAVVQGARIKMLVDIDVLRPNISLYTQTNPRIYLEPE